MPVEPHKCSTDKMFRPSWIDSAPLFFRPYLLLSRYDRPAGFWLLALPCWIGLSLVWMLQGFAWRELLWIVVFGAGAVFMRGAGCVWNDILDRRLDAQVRRTRTRPLPSGRIGLVHALVWMLIQCAAGLLILLCLPVQAKYVALAAIPLVSLYPLMKRISWWPQIWLGLTFNWGVWIAAFTTGEDLVTHLPVMGALLSVYVALAFWTLGYDTIYALADKADDGAAGIRSTALLFGGRVCLGVGISYLLSVFFLSVASWLIADPLMLPGVAVFAVCLFRQLESVGPDMGQAALPVFVVNVRAGWWLAGLWLLGSVV